MRVRLLRLLYKLLPFDLAGDCTIPPSRDGIKISCIINFYGRIDLLSGVLFSLAAQEFPRNLFEVVLIEDRGGSEAGRKIAENFQQILPIVYRPLDKNYGYMGYSRNHGLSVSRGKYILFLDDDTIIQQNDFLRILSEKFDANPDCEAITPLGQASYALIEGKYDYHERYFMSNRCTAYRRAVLAELGGFMSSFIGQEDVEFVFRFHMAGKKTISASDLHYFHPPLLINSLNKPIAVGLSFYGLRRRYPLFLWLLALVNCSRHAPLSLIPFKKYQEMGRYGRGFSLGVLAGIRGKKKKVRYA